ncbi:MAG: phage holin family protein [Actinomycetes bacterium]|jgi:putative membrane protein|nr:phage holin family protein [Actinomycetes bacterium]
MKFVIRWLVSSIAVAAAVLLVPGIGVEGSAPWLPIVVVGLLLGLVNASFGTIIRAISFGCIFLTLGIFSLVINAWMLQLSAWVATTFFAVPLYVTNFWAAFWGGIVISLVTMALNAVLPPVSPTN